jgi:hypothetical protein
MFDKKHGAGKLEWPSGAWYEGNWFNGEIEGTGLYKPPSA